MKTIYCALMTVWQQISYRWLSLLAFIAFLILYLFTLPSAFTGGQISMMTLEYLDVSMVLLSISMASLVALIISLMTWLIRQGQKSSKASATSGVLVGIFTPYSVVRH
ncbi:hypothetical protein [sulfur-oxidizing endosymbiont of Gigantopelta aegis]|uniref:hypothetical protein n=1 Tax=sulfur-oxidizing endosymbiont of Gigantopelta aegis TaxID=2794934 RepID=UPI0018DB488F|nr:hypothetical protein [sulfur-oxidizing endosymbiont of Gigantopelta aegis]